ncbi:HAD-IC family P-type ATPase [Candidatus Parcubacteria bacterium]|nr:HAD-IC family P-type ATPase [Candidatus Parcubacteria bacterium]
MQTPWHSLTAVEVCRRLSPSPEGLGKAAVERRRREFGSNEIPLPRPPSALLIFLRQFNSPLIYIVFVAVGISIWLGHVFDAVFIALVILINTVLGFFQERKAGATAAALKRYVREVVRVRRGGYDRIIPAAELVMGDRIAIRMGDRIPADARLIVADNLKTEESALTGEWLPVMKSVDAVPADAAVTNRVNMVWAGTLAAEGEGEAVVTAVGAATEFGRTVALLGETVGVRTPLQRRLVGLSMALGVGIVAFVVVLLGVGLTRGKAFDELFVASLALIVSAIPEGLLPLMTVVLALGMRRVLRVRGLVRNLAATETLGAITVICTDKTGTLTEGRMQVSHILTNTRELLHKPPYENFNHNGVESHIVALKVAVLANDAFIENPDETFKDWVVRGRPTERALVLAGMHSGLRKHELESQYPRIVHLSFESSRGYAASLRKDSKGWLLVVLGEPEQLIAISDTLHADGASEALTREKRAALRADVARLASQGIRVVACATRRYHRRPTYVKVSELVKKLTFVGLIGLSDPIRVEAKHAIATARRAGIRPVMVTGDHPGTALAVAKEVGLIEDDDEHVLTGEAVEEMSDKTLQNSLQTYSVFARVVPRTKVRIVETLQNMGQVVAMTGDGVNDAPALRRADVGLALGSGTDVAKESADMILLDDNFKTITDAVEEGRTTFGTIRKVIIYLLADDFSELILFLGTMAMGMPIPLLPAQILWINVIEDGFPGTALAFEGKEHEVMADPPRDPAEPIFHRPLRKFAAFMALITGIAALGTFVLLWLKIPDLDRVRTIVFALMAIDSLVLAFIVRAIRKPIVREDIFSNKLLVAAGLFGVLLLMFAVYLPAFQRVLSTVALQPFDWLIVFGVSAAELVFLEIAKQRCFGRVRAA